MPKEDITPTVEVKETAPVETPAVDTPAEEPTLEATLSDLQPEAPKVPDAIPYDRFKAVNDDKKALEDTVKDLTEKLAAKESAPTATEVRSDLTEIAQQHGLNPEVLGQVASAIEAKAMAAVDAAVAPVTQRERQTAANTAFEKMYSDALENNPEYQDVANKEVIKQLAFIPANANLTFSQLLEKTYSGVVKPAEGKPTMETTKPRGGGEDHSKVDFERAQKDADYMKQVKADPGLLKDFNEQQSLAVQARI